MDKVYRYVIENDYNLGMTAVRNLDFRVVCQVLKLGVVVEIGTFCGATAAYMAQFADKVHTFDIRNLYDKHTWEKLSLADKIEFHHVKNCEETAKILSDLDFDFAFIDDDHLDNTLRKNFDMVKKCGRVLFHDIEHPKFPDVSKFMDEIGARRLDRNGYWMEGI
jgi:predicted O-methyltransferase YrrM